MISSVTYGSSSKNSNMFTPPTDVFLTKDGKMVDGKHPKKNKKLCAAGCPININIANRLGLIEYFKGRDVEEDILSSLSQKTPAEIRTENVVMNNQTDEKVEVVKEEVQNPSEDTKMITPDNKSVQPNNK